MYSCVIRISLICTRMSLVCHSYVTRVYSYIVCMYSYVILMSLVCTCMTFICHSYVLVRNVISLAYTRISSVYHSYVICISVACAGILSASHVTPMYFMSSVCPSHVLYVMLCHSYVLVYHPYVTRLWFHHEPFFFPFFSKKLFAFIYICLS